MDIHVRENLITIVVSHGQTAFDDSRRLRALLNDECPGLKREVNVLIAALELRIPQEIMSASHELPWPVFSARLIQRLVTERAMEELPARWAVDSWGVALGRVSESALSDNQDVEPSQQEPVLVVTPLSEANAPLKPEKAGERGVPPPPIRMAWAIAIRQLYRDDDPTKDAVLMSVKAAVWLPANLMILTGVFHICLWLVSVPMVAFTNINNMSDAVMGSICFLVQLPLFGSILLGGIRFRQVRSRSLVILGACIALAIGIPSVLCGICGLVMIAIPPQQKEDPEFVRILVIGSYWASLGVISSMGLMSSTYTLVILSRREVYAAFDRQKSLISA
jgi:hypothetical protein